MRSRTAEKFRGMSREQRGLQGYVPQEDFPSFARPFSEVEQRRMSADIQLAETEYYRDQKREMNPWEKLLLCQETLARNLFGAAPGDMMLGQIPSGPLRGRKIALDGGTALAGLRNMGTGQPLGLRVQLADRLDTVMGNTAGDRALIESVSDTNILGGTTGLLPPAIWDEILVKTSRAATFLPMCKIGICPGPTWEQWLRVRTIHDVLFEGTNLRDMKATTIPRIEGAIGIEMGPAYEKALHVLSNSFLYHTGMSWEALQAIRGSMIGMEADVRQLLGEAPLAVGDHTIIQQAWAALELGYQRRWDKTNGPAWEAAVGEVPFGKAAVITTNSPKFQAYWNYEVGAIYVPVASADYKKYHSSLAIGDSALAHLKKVYGVNTNKVLEIMLFIAGRMRDNGRRLGAVHMPHWLLEMYAMDDRAQNRLYAPVANLRFQGAAGYVGTINLLGFGEPVDVFSYDPGACPGFVSADSSAVTFDGLVIGYEPGEFLTYMPWIPPTMMVSPEYKLVGASASGATRPTMRDVVSLYHAECVECYDPRAAFMVKMTNVTHG